MIKLRRDKAGKVFTNANGVPLTATQVDVDERDADIARLCEIAGRHRSSMTKAVAAMRRAEPKPPEKDAYWLADYVTRAEPVTAAPADPNRPTPTP